MLSITEERFKKSAGTGVLALGTDSRPRVSWIEKDRLFSVFPAEGPLVDLQEFYHRVLRLAVRRRWKPRWLAFDPHPFFVSRQLVNDFQRTYFPRSRPAPVYHHQAHAAGGFWDIPQTEKFLAVTFDGTGFGQDGRVWGGEFFLCGSGGFRRMAHLAYQPLPGGDAAVLEPWRVAYAVLKNYKSPEADILFRKIPAQKRAVISHMSRTGLGTVLTSSAGRLFDAAAALTGLKWKVRRQAEAAQSLQEAARRFSGSGRYRFPLRKEKGVLIMETGAVLLKMASDIVRGENSSQVARKFHLGLAQGVFEVCDRLAAATGILDIYLSGGVFLNTILTGEVRALFEKSRCRLHIPSRAHITDEGISRGQAAYCAFVARRQKSDV
ncbi:MAG: hypothetical protein WC732_06925 [Candidatus Omnitrophota bacterium]